MNESPENIERIEKYIEGSLSADEQVAFEQELQANPELRSQVNMFKEAIQGLKNEGVLNELKMYHQEMVGQKRSFWKYSVGIAASIILLSLALVFFYQSIQTPPTKLFDQYFEAYPNLITSRGTNTNDQLSNAMQYYDKGMYDSALFIFEEIEKNKRLASEEIFYKSISLLADEKPDEAIRSFKNLAVKDSTYREQANWYISLAYIKDNNLNEAQLWLSKIEDSHFKYSSAQQLLSHLKD